jgi:multiple sugar transport system substrate-binding protein
VTKRLRIAVRNFADFENALTEEIELFQRAQPDIEVEMVPMDLHVLQSELFTKNGLRNGTWDIGLLVTDWLAEAVAEDALEDLTPWLREKPLPDWPAGWATSLTEPVYFGNQLSSLPWHDGPECLIYRRDLFEDESERRAFREQYGYELSPPRTWEDFEDIAAFFTRTDQGRYGTVFAAYPDGHNTLYDFALQVWSRGGELQNAMGKPTIDTPETVAALDFYRRLVRDPLLCHPGSPQLNSTQSGDVFLSGSVALMVNWFGFAARCDRPGSPLANKVALAPIPSAAGKPPVSLSVFWTLGIGKGSRQKQAAYDFLHFVARPEADLSIVKHGPVGVRLSTWRSAEIQRQVPCYQKIEEISLGARKMPRSRHLPVFAEIINDVVVKALRTEEASQSILHEAQERIDQKQIIFS